VLVTKIVVPVRILRASLGFSTGGARGSCDSDADRGRAHACLDRSNTARGHGAAMCRDGSSSLVAERHGQRY
jgi:hypothetical protein